MSNVLSFPGTRWRVLIIDDSPCIARVVRNALQETDIAFELQDACGLDEALVALDEQDWDLILLDNWMPPFTSFETPLYFIRQAGYSGEVALLSADIVEEARRHVLSGALLAALNKQDIDPEMFTRLHASTRPRSKKCCA